MVYKCLMCGSRFIIDKYNVPLNSYSYRIDETVCQKCIDSITSGRCKKDISRKAFKLKMAYRERNRLLNINGLKDEECFARIETKEKDAVNKSNNPSFTFKRNNENASTSESRLLFDTNDIIEEFDSSCTTELFNPNDDSENRNPNVPVEDDMDDGDNIEHDLADGVDENFLNSFHEEKNESVVYNHQMEEKRDYLRKKLDHSKRFYFESNNQLTLNRQSFLKYSGIPTFEVGYAWKNRVDRMDKIELMAQLVNEINQIKSCCLQLYYRESSCLVSTKRREKLIRKYIGKNFENEFKDMVEKEVKEFIWFLDVYKKRFLEVKNRLIKLLGIDEDFIKSIKSYEDVYDYFIYRLDVKDINKM